MGSLPALLAISYFLMTLQLHMTMYTVTAYVGSALKVWIKNVKTKRGVVMDNLRRLDPEWYTKGMVGETVLMNMEHYLFNKDSEDIEGFTRWGLEFGLNKNEIISVINEAKEVKGLGNFG